MSSSSSPLSLRDIVAIDEALCNGCGLCLPACAEGALTIENGKVRIKADKLCDGLGACLGVCPRGALRIEQRPATPFDAQAAADQANASPIPSEPPAPSAVNRPAGRPSAPLREGRTWPLKLQLTPVDKPFLRNARLLLTADCAPAACAGFSSRYLPGKVMLLTCPKLEDKGAIVERLTRLFQANPPSDIAIIRMEVPCCCLPDLVQRALETANLHIPVNVSTLTRFGQENLPGFGKGGRP